MFENLFVAEMKRLKLKRYDVCEMLKCTMPTLKSRLQNPTTFTIEESIILIQSGFDLNKIMDSIFDQMKNDFKDLLWGLNKENVKLFPNLIKTDENN